MSLAKNRPRRTIKPIKRLTYDELGGPPEEPDRDDDSWGSDLEEIDELEEAKNNPFDDPTKNEYSSEGINDEEEELPTEEEEEETETEISDEEESTDDIEELLDTDTENMDIDTEDEEFIESQEKIEEK